jgi:hypothetical protein
MSNSATLVALAAVFAAAVLAMVMLGLIIWRQRAEQDALREQLNFADQQLAAAGAQLSSAAAQQAALQAEVERVRADHEDLEVTSPVEWGTCLSCRSPLQVVLCPHCHAPYHKQWTSPRGATLNCWESVLASGRCWNCKQDLTPFQKAPGAGRPVVMAVAPPGAAHTTIPPHDTTGTMPPVPAGPPSAPQPAAPLPRVVRPTRPESPPTPEMLEWRRQGGSAAPDSNGASTSAAPGPTAPAPPRGGAPLGDDDDFKVV